MKNMKKWMTALVLLAVCAASVPTAAVQAETVPPAAVSEDVMQPYGVNCDEPDVSLSITGTTATCISSVQGYSNVTRVEIDQYLEKRSFLLFWNEVKSWSDSTLKNTLTLNKEATGLESGTYRVRTVFRVYVGNTYEEIEVKSGTATVS